MADPKKGKGKKPKGSGRRLYTDEDPKDTVGVKFSSRQDIVDTFNKKSFKAKSHARQSQIINLVHQRVRAAYNRAKDPAVKKRLKTENIRFDGKRGRAIIFEKDVLIELFKKYIPEFDVEHEKIMEHVEQQTLKNLKVENSKSKDGKGDVVEHVEHAGASENHEHQTALQGLTRRPGSDVPRLLESGVDRQARRLQGALGARRGGPE